MRISDWSSDVCSSDLSTGHITYPGYEHIRWRSVVQEMVPERLFSFTWHPYAIEPGVDYSDEPPTLVEFRLEPSGDGTLLTVTESGFDPTPAHPPDEAFRLHYDGWTEPVPHIKRPAYLRAEAPPAHAPLAAPPHTPRGLL